ncbi:MAG: hypothetical protein JXB14_02470 [Candidatus Altiarchaeota archaeon]|nr:hypothetical protein [Candidatus Altiarchaeota archaeon]
MKKRDTNSNRRYLVILIVAIVIFLVYSSLQGPSPPAEDEEKSVEEARCGDGVWQSSEMCDPDATPTGCSKGICTNECTCITVEETCADRGEYTDGNCSQTCENYQQCMPNAEGCFSCTDICDTDEYMDSGCLGKCPEGKKCVLKDKDQPCYLCVEKGEQTCEERGMHTIKSGCDESCKPPDYCAFYEEHGCWYCKDMTCAGGLYEDENCRGRCDPRKGEICKEFQDGCYNCVCPDLHVSFMSGGIRKDMNVTCQGDDCETRCSVTGTITFRVRNAGTLSAAASTALVELDDIDSEEEGIDSLNTGEESDTRTLELKKTDRVNGRADACEDLSWWKDSYTISVTADYGNSVAECNEKNNAQSAESKME